MIVTKSFLEVLNEVIVVCDSHSFTLKLKLILLENQPSQYSYLVSTH